MYASSIGSSGGPITPICHTWSITLIRPNPTSSAVVATRARFSASPSSPPGHEKFEMCRPMSIDTLSPEQDGRRADCSRIERAAHLQPITPRSTAHRGHPERPVCP